MNAGTRQVMQVAEQTQKKSNSIGDRRTSIAVMGSSAAVNSAAIASRKPRVFVAAENRLLREALSRMLVKDGKFEAVGMDVAGPFRTEDLLKEEADILLHRPISPRELLWSKIRVLVEVSLWLAFSRSK